MAQPAERKPLRSFAAAAPATDPSTSSAALATVDEDLDEDLDGDELADDVDHDAAACGVDNCPHCKDGRRVQVCGVTQKRVYPPMTKRGAKGVARAVLGGAGVTVALGVWILRGRSGGLPIVKWNERERDELAEDLMELQKRFTAIGAGNDVFSVLTGVGDYMVRAATEAPEPQTRSLAQRAQEATTDEPSDV